MALPCSKGLWTIGYHNILVGGGLFLGAFVCFLAWFVKHERARRWGFGVRVAIAVLAALVYFSVIGRQLYRQYRIEAAAPVTVKDAGDKGKPETSPGVKVFVDVDAAYFASLYRNHSTVQADEAIRGYIGEWIRVTGDVGDVTTQSRPDSLDVTLAMKTADPQGIYVVLATFNDPRSIERVRILGRGESVTVVGKITRANAMGIVLDDCEIAR